MLKTGVAQTTGKCKPGYVLECIKKRRRCASVLESVTLANSLQVRYVVRRPVDLATRQRLLKTTYGFCSSVASRHELAQEWVKESCNISSCRNLITIFTINGRTWEEGIVKPNGQPGARPVLEDKLVEVRQRKA